MGAIRRVLSARLFVLVALVPAPFSTMLYGQTIPGEYTPDANTVLLLHMNEPGGSFVADASGLGNHGTAFGTRIVDAVFGKARGFDGLKEFVDTGKLLDVVNTFTMEALVYPTAPHQIDAESNQDRDFSGLAGQRYAIWPNYGDDAWGPSHAGAGISVGTNGVSVYEHAKDYMPAILVWEGSLSNWTHIAVVYRNKRPSLYINGNLVKEGKTSSKTVHPCMGGNARAGEVGGIGGGRYGYFQGRLDEVRISKIARTEEEFILLPAIDFGRILVGRTASDSVTVTNTTSAEVNFGPITLSGPNAGNFGADTTPFSLAAGKSKKIAVNFTPDRDGPFRAALTFSTAAGNINADLRGLGIPATFAIPGEYIPDANTVLLMHMNEPGGSSVADASGSGNNGTAIGTTITDGVFGKARDFDGVNDYVDTGKLLDVVDTFTMEALVYPTAPHEIDAESNSGISGDRGQRYVIWPTQGNCAWGPNHAGAGISVGTNGVSVYEHAENYMPAILVWQGSLSGWTHIAVVYRNKQPSLYINGNFVKEGKTSLQIVHPSIGTVRNACEIGGIGGGIYGSFPGRIDEVRISNNARTPDEFQIPPAINFGEILVGTTATDGVTITNSETTAVNISAITISGAHANKFSVDATPFTLAPGASKTLPVSFTPDAQGEFNALLKISTDAGDINVPLSGTGIGATFTRITAGAIVSDGGDSYGSSWGDYDNDGHLDLFVANNGQNNLYRNDGNGAFIKITTGNIVTDGGSSKGGAWGDFDNDNDLDLFVANDGGQNNFLYFNNGNGAFTKITTGDIVNDGGNSRGSSMGDYDNDGDLDLFVANAVEDFLYANNGDGSFAKIIAGDVVADQSNSQGSSWADYDNDGDLDLFVAGSTNRLYRNDGNGVFTKIANSPIVTEGGGRSGSWGDYDNDGDLDLFVTGTSGDYRLYSNNGNGNFTNATIAARVNDGGDSFGGNWGDYDNDGDLDLFVINRGYQNNFLYSNNGDRTFTRITIDNIGFNESFANACSWADYDNDGDLDLFVVTGNNKNNFLYRNNGNRNHWINIKCVGTVSNASAIGAKVRVKAIIKGRSVWQLQEISAQTGAAFGSQNSFNAEFGLGEAMVIDSIKIQWPSKKISILTNIAADQFLTVHEADLSISTRTIAFGEVLNAETVTDTVTVTNLGTADLNFGPITLSGVNPDNFSVATTTFTLAPRESKLLEASFTPKTDGKFSAFLNISIAGANLKVALRGTGIGATFARIAAGTIVSDAGDSYGCSWGDYDNDGDLDLFVANSLQNNFLYRNNGNGTFTKITTGVIVNDEKKFSRGGAWGDFDNDGDSDLFVANDVGQNNFLYFNNGNGTFTKITAGNIVNDGGSSQGGSLGDYDNDGNLDLFVANTAEDFLYANNGNGNFTKIIAGEIVTDISNSEGSSWADYDNDGDLDLFVAGSANLLYQNNGVFTKITDNIISKEGGGRSGSWGDYDNDGDLDLFVTAFSAGAYRLYSNNGDGSFANVTEAAGVNDRGDSYGSSWGDYDNDGDLDLVVINRGNQNNFLYSNNGDGAFTRITIDNIDFNEGFANACSWADYDNDGDLDLFVANSNNQNNFLFRNNGNRNHWINIKCVGTVSNRSAIGAKVWVKATIKGKPVWQLQEIAGQTGAAFGSQNSLNAEFGLGDAATIDSIKIQWPSRNVSILTSIAADKFLTVTETAFSLRTDSLALVDLYNSAGGANWTKKDNWLSGPVASWFGVTVSDGRVTRIALPNSNLVGTLPTAIGNLTSLVDLDLHDNRLTGAVPNELANMPRLQNVELHNNRLVDLPDLRPLALLRDLLVQNNKLTFEDIEPNLTAPSGRFIYAPQDSVGARKDTTVAFGAKLTLAVAVGGTRNQYAWLKNDIPIPVALDSSYTINTVDYADSGSYFCRITNSLATALTLYTHAINVRVIGFAPAAPRNLRAIDGDRQVTLIWDANTELDFLRYRIYGGTSPNPVTVIDSVAERNNTTKTIPGLINDTNYFFRITAVNRILQESGFSNETTARPSTDTTPPNIQHTPTLAQTAGQEIPIVANVTDNRGVAGATLSYRRGGDISFTRIPMSDSGGLYRATIPAEAVTSRGVEYFILATDLNSRPGRMPVSGIFSVQVNVPDLVKGSAQPGGSEQNAYRLVSVPLDLDDKSAKSVLEDDLGPYDDTKWRFSELRIDQTYAEFPNTSAMTPGTAFWLLVKDPGKVIDTGAGKSNVTSRSYAIPLHPAWNFVANPFNFPIPLKNLRMKSEQSIDLRSYTGSWSDLPVDTLKPFEGYAVFSELSIFDTLLVNPDLSSMPNALLKNMPATATATAIGVSSWSIRILAQCQQARDVDNLAAVIPGASRDFDEWDRPEPPVIGEYVSVYFPHHDWEPPTPSYCTDVRSEFSHGEIWEFEMTTNIRDKVNLTFEGVAQVPKEFEVWVIDEALHLSQNLREMNVYTIAGAGPDHPKRSKLVVGRHDFVAEKLAEVKVIPTAYELSQNFPNPFNPATTIRYGLPQAEKVTLKVYNLLGAEVATLVNDEQKKAGYHAAIWDGRNQNGGLAASGIYIYRLHAGGVTMTKKMVLAK